LAAWQLRPPAPRSFIKGCNQGGGLSPDIGMAGSRPGQPRAVIAIRLSHLRGQGHDRPFPGGLGHVKGRAVRRSAADPEPRPVLHWNVQWPQNWPVLHF